jgi:predicted nucleic acid-binding protein
MRTAVDTNVFLDILRPNPAFVDNSERWLAKLATQGDLVICDMVFAELCSQFPTIENAVLFLYDLDVRIESLSHEASFAASRAWLQYRKSGGKRERILADFIIGAHAQNQCDGLLSRDRGFYREHFETLKLIDPSTDTVSS